MLLSHHRQTLLIVKPPQCKVLHITMVPKVNSYKTRNIFNEIVSEYILFAINTIKIKRELL